MSWINSRPSPILYLHRWFERWVWKLTLSSWRRFDSVVPDQMHWRPWGYYNQPKQGLGEYENMDWQVESDIWTIKVRGYDNIQEKDSNQASISVWEHSPCWTRSRRRHFELFTVICLRLWPLHSSLIYAVNHCLGHGDMYHSAMLPMLVFNIVIPHRLLLTYASCKKIKAR